MHFKRDNSYYSYDPLHIKSRSDDIGNDRGKTVTPILKVIRKQLKNINSTAEIRTLLRNKYGNDHIIIKRKIRGKSEALILYNRSRIIKDKNKNIEI